MKKAAGNRLSGKLLARRCLLVILFPVEALVSNVLSRLLLLGLDYPRTPLLTHATCRVLRGAIHSSEYLLLAFTDGGGVVTQKLGLPVFIKCAVVVVIYLRGCNARGLSL